VLANGDTVWLSSTAGALTNVKPTADMLHEVGVVVDAATRRVLLQQKPVIALPPSPPDSLWVCAIGNASHQYLSPAWVDQGAVSPTDASGMNILWDGNLIWTASLDNPAKIRAYDPITRALVYGPYTYGYIGSAPYTNRKMAFDGANYWILSGTNIQKFSAAGVNLGTVSVTSTAMSVVYDGAGCLWVSEQYGSKIRRINVASGTVTGTVTMASDGASCSSNCTVVGSYAYQVCYANPSPYQGRLVRWPIAAVGPAITPDWEALMGFNYPLGPSGSDGTYLWSSTHGGAGIGKNRLSDGGLVGAYNLGAAGHSGICYNNGFMWLTAADDFVVKKINPADGTYVNHSALNNCYGICDNTHVLPYP